MSKSIPQLKENSVTRMKMEHSMHEILSSLKKMKMANPYNESKKERKEAKDKIEELACELGAMIVLYVK